MSGVCYQKAMFFYYTQADGKIVEKIANHLVYGFQPNGVEVLLYPHDGKILFYGSFKSSSEETDYANLEAVIKSFIGKDIETALENVDKNKNIKLVEE